MNPKLKGRIRPYIQYFCMITALISFGTTIGAQGTATAKLGELTWMTQNLTTTTCQNGTPIESSNFKEQAGAVTYNYLAIENCDICPEGWRLIERSDFIALRELGLSAADIAATLNINSDALAPNGYLRIADGMVYHGDLASVLRGSSFTSKGGADYFANVRCVTDKADIGNASQNLALQFDGANDFVDATGTASGLPQGRTARTMEAWVKTSQQNIGNIVSWGRRANHMRNSMAVRGGKLAYIGQYLDFTGKTPINDGKWHHVALSYDGEDWAIYVDGKADGTNGADPNTTDQNLKIGNLPQPHNGEYFNGAMDELRIWNVARTAEQIVGNMNKELSGDENGLIAYYNFNQGQAGGNNTGETTLIDVKGNGNGTLSGFALSSITSNFVASGVDLEGAGQAEIAADAESFAPGEAAETTTLSYQLPMTSEPSVITIEKVGDHAVYEGDIVLYELGGPEDPESGISNDAGIISGHGQHDYRWTNGEIPYVIADQHPKTTDILTAIENLNAQSVLNIRPKRATDTDYVYIENPSSGCWSVVGRKGGRQRMGVSTRCTVGNIMHEFLHAAGMYHEQSRADRDQFLTIDFSNITNGKEGNFEERESKSVCDFDFGSIMQYPAYAFAKDRSKPTIVPLNPLPEGVVMGQRSQLSECDKMGILNLYKTESPQARPYEPYWFTDVFEYSSYRIQGNIYNTGEDWDWKARQEPMDESISDFQRRYFNFQKEVMNDFKVTDFTFEDCKIKIKGRSSKRYIFDIRYGRADLYNQWYDGQYGAISRPASGGGYELSFETTLSACNTDPDHTYFVVVVVKNYDDQTGYLIAEAPMAIRYAHPDSDD